MKKNFLICLFVVVGALSAHSQAPYKHSIGGILGFINGGSYKTFVADNFAIQVDFGFPVHHIFLGAEANANFMYEQAIKNGFYWLAGGGVSLGGGVILVGKYNPFGLKLGLNAMGGAEYKFTKIPLTLQADIRPGVAFYAGGGGFSPYFDYNFVNASARYTF